MKRIISLMVLPLALTTFLWGCELAILGIGAGVGAGTYRYVEGSLERLYPVSYSSAWDITNTALANLYISVTNSINEGLKGTIEGMQKDGTRITIKLTDKGQEVTNISIRVGFWGSRKDAERIHEEIKTVAGLR